MCAQACKGLAGWPGLYPSASGSIGLFVKTASSQLRPQSSEGARWEPGWGSNPEASGMPAASWGPDTSPSHKTMILFEAFLLHFYPLICLYSLQQPSLDSLFPLMPGEGVSRVQAERTSVCCFHPGSLPSSSFRKNPCSAPPDTLGDLCQGRGKIPGRKFNHEPKIAKSSWYRSRYNLWISAVKVSYFLFPANRNLVLVRASAHIRCCLPCLAGDNPSTSLFQGGCQAWREEYCYRVRLVFRPHSLLIYDRSLLLTSFLVWLSGVHCPLLFSW